MAFNVNDFRQGLRYDGARPNLFQVNLNFPNVVNSGSAASTSQFLVKTAQLPGSTLGTVSLNYFGRELKFAGNRTFQDWTVTVINDEDFLIRASLENWMNQINGHVSNLRAPGFQTPQGYTTLSNVFQFGKDGSTLKHIDIYGMFPIDLSPIDLDWGSNDSIEEYSVTFAYQYWVDNTTGVTGGAAANAPTTT
jgi:hypothetical protein